MTSRYQTVITVFGEQYLWPLLWPNTAQKHCYSPWRILSTTWAQRLGKHSHRTYTANHYLTFESCAGHQSAHTVLLLARVCLLILILHTVCVTTRLRPTHFAHDVHAQPVALHLAWPGSPSSIIACHIQKTNGTTWAHVQLTRDLPASTHMVHHTSS